MNPARWTLPLVLTIAVAGCHTAGTATSPTPPSGVPSAVAAGVPPFARSAAPTSSPTPPRVPGSAGPRCAAVAAGSYLMTLVGRRVRVTVPTGFDGRQRLPVAIAFHGYSGDANGFDAYTGLPGLIASRRAVLATPQGAGSPAGWNYPRRSAIGPDDVTFTASLLDALASRLCTLATQALATGWSDGADMAVTVACALPGRFTAVGLVSASTTPPAGCRAPITVLAAHGTGDRIEPYSGGAPDGRPGYQGMTSVGPEQAEAAWARVDHCRYGPTRMQLTAHVSRLSWQGCVGAYVSLYRVDGGGHTWPGAGSDRPELGATSREINAGALILDAWLAMQWPG